MRDRLFDTIPEELAGAGLDGDDDWSDGTGGLMAGGPLARATGRVIALPGELARAIMRQQDRWFLWAPVLLAAGSAGYFSLKVEPPLAVFAAALMIIALCLVIIRRQAGFLVPAMVMLVAGGFVLGKVRTVWVAAPVLHASTGKVTLTGEVLAIEAGRRKTTRLVLKVRQMSGIRRSAWPGRIRVSIRRLRKVPAHGDVVRLTAWGYPSPQPVTPGGFDFSRVQWFRGIGGGARGSKDLAVVSKVAPMSWPAAKAMAGEVRTAIERRIRAQLAEPRAGLAIALITGHRGTIEREVRNQLQVAGLAHILAISGLHMSLVAGGVFWLVRALLATFAGLSLTRPVKKWAALAAMAAGAGYLIISGAGIATQRAYIMLAIMCLAIVADKASLTLRNVALAAMIILALSPEAATSASFQMSFMAVTGLIAFYEAVNNWRARRPVSWWPKTVAGRIAMGFLAGFTGMMLTTLVASLFTGLPAAYHFHRISAYGLLANMLALPVVTFMVMPAAVVSVMAMLLGLEAWPLWVMGQGINLVTDIAQMVSGLDGSHYGVAGFSTAGTLVLALAGLWLCLWRGRLRLVALGLAVPGVVLIALPQPRADIFIERTGRNVAFRNPAGLLVAADGRRSRYSVENWLTASGDVAGLAVAGARPGWTCTGKACRAKVKGRQVVYVRKGAVMPGACKGADILIAGFPLRGACRDVPVRIDRFDLWRNGAHALYVSAGGVRIKTVNSERGDRPWTLKPVPRKSIKLEVKQTGPAKSAKPQKQD